MNKIKVCHLTSAHSKNDTRIFHKECQTLVDAGYDVSLVVQNDGDEVIDGVKILGVAKPKNRIERMLKTTRLVYQRALECDADIYHFHDPELMPIGLKLKRKSKKVIYDVHEDVPQQILGKEWIPKLIRSFVSNIYAFYQNKVINKFDAVITVTPHIYDKLRKYKDRSLVVTNYPIIKNESEESKEQTKTGGEQEYVSLYFAGGVSEQWSHEYIIRALEFIPDVKYIIFGTASPLYIEKLSALKGYEKVDYRGVIPHEQVGAELKKATMGMAICQYNSNAGGNIGTLGNTKLFEYMLAGIPVICTDFQLWQEIVDINRCGICVNPANVNEIAQAINYLRDNPEKAREMGERGKNAVLNEYNWDNEGEKLVSLYKNFE